MKKTTLLLALSTLLRTNTNTQLHTLAAPARIARALAHLLSRRTCFWAGLLALAALASGPQPVSAAVTEAWVQRYNNKWVSNSEDAATKVVRDAAGDIIVAGTTDDGLFGPDMLTIKYSGADGTVLWQKRYNGPANGADSPSALALDTSGNVVVTGYSESFSSGNYYTAKYATADGALIWEQRSKDGGLAVAVDASGNVVVTGDSGVWPQLDYYMAKCAAVDGALLWEKRGPSGGAAALAVDGSGNVVVTGSSNNGSDPYYGADYYTAKYAAADGALLWEQRSTNDEARAIALDGSGNVVVTGYSTSKYAAADGALLWENSEKRGTAWTEAVAVDGSGNVVVTGFARNCGSCDEDYYTARYAAADGVRLWEKRYSGSMSAATDSQAGYAHALTVDGSGNVVVTGSHYNCSGCTADYYTAKYAGAEGELLWEKRYNGSSNSADVATGVAVDGSGTVAVTGYSHNERGLTEYDTARYAVADGALLWEHRLYLQPMGHPDARANAVALDGSGNVVVTGSYSFGGNPNYYTAKYAAADGALLWEQGYNRSANDQDLADEALAMAVDASGNVVVTGSSGTYPNSYYYTFKYAAADGALLWSKRGSSGGPAAVAVDSSGNVIVTGSSKGDSYTAKYAAADGAMLWEKRYNGPANSDDQAQALAVDTSGNVLVTGSSKGNFYTAKYAAADGALLWEKRSNSGDSANALAVDTSGNVVVTGSSYTGSKTGYYTAKYAAADGVLLWEQRYQSPGNNYSGARAVAVDESGNVVVTGISDNGTNTDYYTAKYAAADGVLLWEKRYNGPANGSDAVLTSHSLALGPNGMVAITGSSSGNFATVVYRENLPPISIDLVPTGVRLRFTGVPGRSYTIERAAAVNGPWTTINTQTAPAPGLLEYLAASPLPGQTFYRTVQP